MTVEITDHADRAKTLLLSQYKDKTNFTKIIDIFGGKIQELETVYFELMLDRALSTAVGVQLDGLGDILGEERLARSDSDYRAALSIRIKINISSGEPETLIDVFAALTDATTVQYSEFYPAGAQLTSDGSTLPTNLADGMYSIAPATVSLILIIMSGTPFTFEGDPDGAGFADVGFSTGAGEFSEAIE